MDRASVALVDNRYIECERLCVEAIARARQAGDFDRLGRIMLPLQEARRQRRQAAEDHGTAVLTGARRAAAEILDDHPQGCLMMTEPPYTPADGDAVRDEARRRGLFVEVMVMDNAALTGVFCRAMEQAGDAVLAAIDDHATPVQRIDAISAELDRIGDHERAHQRLADAARAAARQNA
ncbi:MAG: hypothetical protein GVY27_06995 [Deinococcus-Thermus bacterium]|nr:hypothetical protein [Deinococcota bacterium]